MGNANAQNFANNARSHAHRAELAAKTPYEKEVATAIKALADAVQYLASEQK